MSWIGDSWDGEEDLGKVVWRYGALLLVVGWAALLALRIFTDISIDSPASGVGTFFRVLKILYSIWMLVSLWRCAYNVVWKGWGYLTRLIVILYILLYCFFSYAEQRPLLPEEVFTKADTVQLSQITTWLKSKPTTAPAKPTQNKKSDFSIKFN